VLGPRGWYKTADLSAQAVRRALTSSGAMRKLPNEFSNAIQQVQADATRNRGFAFLDAICGPVDAVEIHEWLATLEVAVVGCGGIGSTVAALLAGLGVRRFVLVDADVVEEGNLSRQLLYTLRDVGLPKVEVLSRALEDRFRDLQVRRLALDALDPRAILMIQDCSLVVCAGDDPPILPALLEEQLGHQVPVWACGYALGISVVRPPGRRPRAASSMPHWQGVSGGVAPSIGFQNLEIAARCCAEIVLGRGRSGAPYGLDYRNRRTLL